MRVHVVHNYTIIKGLDSGKITSLPNLHALFQSSPKIYRMLITRTEMKVVKTLIPSFHGPRYERVAYKLGPTDKKKKKKEMPAFLESRSAKASSTKNN